jgi:ribosomal protein S27E
MRIDVEISKEELEGDYGNYVEGLRLTCDRCGHEVTVFGTSERSAKRGACMLAEECPNGERNYYDVDHWDG